MFNKLQRNLNKKEVRGLIDRITSLMQSERKDEALPIAKKAYDIARKKLDDTEPEYIIVCSRLASLLLNDGQPEESERLLVKLIATAGSVLGETSPEFIAILNNLSLSYWRQGMLRSALANMQRVVEMKRAILGTGNVQYAGNLQDLILILEDLGLVAETEPYVRELAEMFRQKLGENDPSYLNMLENLARACRYAGKEDECQELLAKARSHGGMPFIDVPDEDMDESSYVELAKQLYAKGDYDAAREIHKKILDSSPSTLLSPITRDVMGQIFDPLLSYNEEVEKKGVAAEEAGDFEKAADFYRQRIEMMRVSFGEKHPYVAISLSNLAIVKQKEGQFEEAKNLFREALSLLGKIDELPDEYNISRNIAALFWEICEQYAPDPSKSFDESLSSMKGKPKGYARSLRTVFLQPRPGENPVQTNVRLFIARTRLYESVGDHKRARFLYETALEMMRMVWSSEPQRLLIPIQRLADHCIRQGDFDRADELLQEETQIVEEGFGLESLEFAEALRMRARLFAQLANYGEAEKLLLKAQGIVRKELGDDDPNVMRINDDLIVILTRMGKREEAHHLMRLFVDHFDEDEEVGPNAGEDLQHVATFLLELKEYERAEKLMRRALEIQKNQIGEWDPRYALTLSNLGNLLRLTGCFAEAAACFREAMEIRRLEFGPDHISVANSEIRLALSLAAIGQQKEALEAIKDVLRIDDLLIADVSAISSQHQLFQLLKQQRLNLSVALTLVYQFFREEPDSVRNAYEIVLRRKGLSAEALAARRLPILSGRYPHLQDKLEELSELTSMITQARLRGASATQDDLIEQAIEKKARLEAELSRAMPEMRLEQYPNKATVEQVAEALPAETVLLEYVRIEPYNFKAVLSKEEHERLAPRYIAFLLQAGKPESLQMLDLGEAQAIDKSIAGLLNYVATSIRSADRNLVPAKTYISPQSFLKSGAALRKQIIDPLLNYFVGRNRIFIVPDGELFLLPFDIIPLDSGKHLIDEFSLSFLGAGRDVLRFAKRTEMKHTPPVVVAGADFDLHLPPVSEKETRVVEGQSSVARSLQGAGLRFMPLPGAEAEGREVSSLLKGPLLLSKSRAAASVIRKLESPLLLHLATHGFFLPEKVNGEEELEEAMITSGLALSGANVWLKGNSSPEGIEDGILTAEDVATLNLLETDLVVLSACHSGLGGVVAGEGVFGLRRAFFAAGARTIIMSLWQVPDKETKDLMLHFYKALSEGASKSEALRIAKLTLRESLPHPFYWGSFVCEGDWRTSHVDLFPHPR